MTHLRVLLVCYAGSILTAVLSGSILVLTAGALGLVETKQLYWYLALFWTYGFPGSAVLGFPGAALAVYCTERVGHMVWLYASVGAVTGLVASALSGIAVVLMLGVSLCASVGLYGLYGKLWVARDRGE